MYFHFGVKPPLFIKDFNSFTNKLKLSSLKGTSSGLRIGNPSADKTSGLRCFSFQAFNAEINFSAASEDFDQTFKNRSTCRSAVSSDVAQIFDMNFLQIFTCLDVKSFISSSDEKAHRNNFSVLSKSFFFF